MAMSLEVMEQHNGGGSRVGKEEERLSLGNLSVCVYVGLNW